MNGIGPAILKTLSGLWFYGVYKGFEKNPEEKKKTLNAAGAFIGILLFIVALPIIIPFFLIVFVLWFIGGIAQVSKNTKNRS